MSRSRTHPFRWLVLLTVVALAGAIAVPSAGAGQKFPAVDQPGVGGKDIKRGRCRHESNDPTGGTLGLAFDGAEAYFSYINSTGWVCTAASSCSTRSVTTGWPTTARRYGLLIRTTSSPPYQVVGAPVQRRPSARRRRASRPSARTSNRGVGFGEPQARSAELLHPASVVHLLHLREAGPAVWLPKKLAGNKRRRPRVQRVAVEVVCDGYLKKSFKKYPTVAKIVFLDKSLTSVTPTTTRRSRR